MLICTPYSSKKTFTLNLHVINEKTMNLKNTETGLKLQMWAKGKWLTATSVTHPSKICLNDSLISSGTPGICPTTETQPQPDSWTKQTHARISEQTPTQGARGTKRSKHI